MQGSEEFEWLFAAEYPTVVRTVWLILRDRSRAEDIAQDAFVQLLVHWDKVGRYDSPETWLRRVAIRQAIRAAGRERGLTQRLARLGSPSARSTHRARAQILTCSPRSGRCRRVSARSWCSSTTKTGRCPRSLTFSAVPSPPARCICTAPAERLAEILGEDVVSDVG